VLENREDNRENLGCGGRSSALHCDEWEMPLEPVDKEERRRRHKPWARYM
jgi:hypothetical protein